MSTVSSPKLTVPTNLQSAIAEGILEGFRCGMVSVRCSRGTLARPCVPALDSRQLTAVTDVAPRPWSMLSRAPRGLDFAPRWPNEEVLRFQ